AALPRDEAVEVLKDGFKLCGSHAKDSPAERFLHLVPAEEQTLRFFGNPRPSPERKVVHPAFVVSLSGSVSGAASHDGKILSTKDFTLEGSTGKECEIESTKPKGYISGRVIVIDRRFYQALAMGTNAKLSNSDVSKFLDSFKLIK
ncbi:MAG TPA: hypothetical protein VKD72_05590, partial [Gemmataceae bacterium]|nr:hypothetical protein [Gemmataceae bacterium]